MLLDASCAYFDSEAYSNSISGSDLDQSFNPYDNSVWVCRTYPQDIFNHNIELDFKTKDLLDAVPRSQNLRQVYKPGFADKACAFTALFEA